MKFRKFLKENKGNIILSLVIYLFLTVIFSAGVWKEDSDREVQTTDVWESGQELQEGTEEDMIDIMEESSVFHDSDKLLSEEVEEDPEEVSEASEEVIEPVEKDLETSEQTIVETKRENRGSASLSSETDSCREIVEEDGTEAVPVVGQSKAEQEMKEEEAETHSSEVLESEAPERVMEEAIEENVEESGTEDGKESTPCEHHWIFLSYYQEPDCGSGGLENQICYHCGATQVTGGTPTGEHDYVTETEGDCCSEEIVICAVCNRREIRGRKSENHMDVEDGFCYGCGKKVG